RRQPAHTGGNRIRAGKFASASLHLLNSAPRSATRNPTPPAPYQRCRGSGTIRVHPRSFMEPIFDHDSLLAKKRRALRIADAGAGFLMKRAAGDLEDRLAAVERRFERAATLFSMTSEASDAVSASGKAETVARVEADAALLARQPGEVSPPETAPFAPESLDLVVSLYALHEMNDVPGMLVQVRRALRPDGLFLG